MTTTQVSKKKTRKGRGKFAQKYFHSNITTFLLNNFSSVFNVTIETTMPLVTKLTF